MTDNVVSAPKTPEPGTIENGGSSYVGPGAVDVFRAMVLASSLRLWGKTKILHRGVRVGDLFRLATEYTGRTFKRAQAAEAADAVTAWARAAGAPMVRPEWTVDGIRDGAPWRFLARFNDGTFGCVEHDAGAPGAWRWYRGGADGTILGQRAASTADAAKKGCEDWRA